MCSLWCQEPLGGYCRPGPKSCALLKAQGAAISGRQVQYTIDRADPQGFFMVRWYHSSGNWHRSVDPGRGGRGCEPPSRGRQRALGCAWLPLCQLCHCITVSPYFGLCENGETIIEWVCQRAQPYGIIELAPARRNVAGIRTRVPAGAPGTLCTIRRSSARAEGPAGTIRSPRDCGRSYEHSDLASSF